MRVEWQDFVISSQLLCIFIEGKIKAIQLVNARVIVQTVLLSFVIFFSFYFLNAARAKMSLSRAQNIFMPANINSIVILFTTSGEEHVIPKEAIKGVVSNITVVDNETIEIDEGEYYLLLALLNGSTDTTSANEADEEPVAENFEEQADEDSTTTDAGRPQRKRKRAVNNEFLFY